MDTIKLKFKEFVAIYGYELKQLFGLSIMLVGAAIAVACMFWFVWLWWIIFGSQSYGTDNTKRYSIKPGDK